MNHRAWARRRLFNAIRAGDANLAREVLGGGADPNICDQHGRPAIVKAVRSIIPESGVVDALLDAGGEPHAMDEKGLTALDYARRRLARLGPGPDPVTRSRSLDAAGNLMLSDREKVFIAEIRSESGERGDELVEIYIQERRKAALRQFMPRRELRIIIERLEQLSP
jgi:hypothetical protein